MTREEMIRKVCEGVVKNTEYYSIEHGQYRCMYCEAISDSDRKVTSHKEDCPVLYAEVLLAEPVFDVGDIVIFKEFKLGVVKDYSIDADESLVRFEDGTFWTSNQNLTIVRKGGNDN